MFGYFNRRISSVAGIIVLVLIALAVGLMMEHYKVLKQSVETREFYQQELFGKQ